MTEAFVRPADPRDAARIAAIYAVFVLESTVTFETEPPGAEEILRRMAAVHEAGLPYLVVEEGGEIAGYGYATPFRPRAAYRVTVEHSVYVDPVSHRRGFGSALLDALIAACEAWGARQMIAVIGGDHPASVALHRAHGFEPAGVLRSVGWKFNSWLDVTLMQRPLGTVPKGS